VLTFTALIGALATALADPTSPVGALAYAALLPVVAWIATKLYDGLKTVFPFLDRAPALVHQVLAPLTQFAFGWVSAATGAERLTDLHGVTAGWTGGILTLLLAGGIKRWEKTKAPTDATVVLESSRASTGRSL
jgi:hypothetical protein